MARQRGATVYSIGPGSFLRRWVSVDESHTTPVCRFGPFGVVYFRACIMDAVGAFTADTSGGTPSADSQIAPWASQLITVCLTGFALGDFVIRWSNPAVCCMGPNSVICGSVSISESHSPLIRRLHPCGRSVIADTLYNASGPRD